jgi:hypothetical protein
MKNKNKIFWSGTKTQKDGRIKLEYEMQITDTVLMIKPQGFRFNEETSKTNLFQIEHHHSVNDKVQTKARKEFDSFVKKLRNYRVKIIVVNDTKKMPDAIFPNWITLHSDGTIVIYPMHAKNRRLERRKDIVDMLKKKFKFSKLLDLSSYEKKGLALEGFGSLVLDRVNKIAYACLSERTSLEVARVFCKKMKYKLVKFRAFDSKGVDVYHTDVVMSIGETFAIICSRAIKGDNVIKSLKKTHEVIEISLKQMHEFSGNCFEVVSSRGEKILVMSLRAYKALNKKQIDRIRKYCKILKVNINTIEKHGGGSARCMMLGVYK